MVNGWRRSDLPMLGEGVDLVSGDDKMVEYADVDQCQSLHQRACQQQVRFAGFWTAGWMVVGQHDAGGVARQCLLDHFARIHAGVN